MTTTPRVRTVTVLTAVLVNRDSLEMVQFVKVCENEKSSIASSALSTS